MKIAMIEMNPTVGDLTGNKKKIISKYEETMGNTDLVIFPEMATTGYPIEDLAIFRSFGDEATLVVSEIISEVKKLNGPAIIFGALIKNMFGIFNVAVFYDPKENNLEYVVKYELPNYGVFDEKRTFSSADIENLSNINFSGVSLGVMICEDCWKETVSEKLINDGADILIAINGSPFEINKASVRRQLAIKRTKGEIPFVYVNMLGGQDELVFDGGSFVLDSEGFFQVEPFRVDTSPIYKEVSLDDFNPELYIKDCETEHTKISEVYSATVLGLRDYMRKQDFTKVVLGMSGGVDSGIVAAIACDALGPNNVNLVRLPSKFSSEGSLKDAEAANETLGTKMRTINIEPTVNALRTAYSDAVYDYDEQPKELVGTADENIQARARGAILMAISNQEGMILLSTGNCTENSQNYATLYGDMSGGFNPIKDCYKTTVWEMCRYRNKLSESDLSALGFLGKVGEMIPEEIITKPPSAELKEGQFDSDSLPPYEILDAILIGMIEESKTNAQLVDDGFDEDEVKAVRGRLILSEYKRRQSCPGIKVTKTLHGKDRRFPIVNRYFTDKMS